MAAFKIDENLPGDVADVLRAAHHDVTTVRAQGLGGAPDELVAHVCRAEGRALVTLDVGFADIRRYPPALYPGLVVLRLVRHDRRNVEAAVRRALTHCSGERLDQRLCIITETGVRQRPR